MTTAKKPTRKKYYYKVVKSTIMDGYTSAMATRDDLRITYKGDEFSYPQKEGTKIFVFNTAKNATEWIYEIEDLILQSSLQIFKVEVLNPEKAPKKLINVYYEALERILKFWEDGEEFKTFTRLWSTPKGSYICDAVKLLERVTRKEHD